MRSVGLNQCEVKCEKYGGELFDGKLTLVFIFINYNIDEMAPHCEKRYFSRCIKEKQNTRG
jgi:hypothetical protein